MDYIEITLETSLDEEVCKTKDIPEKLRQTTLRTINTKYPSNEWLRIPYIREYSMPSNNLHTLILGEEILKNNKNGFY